MALVSPFLVAAFRHGLRWRVPAVFWFAVLVRLQWLFNAETIVVLYDPFPVWMDGGALYSMKIGRGLLIGVVGTSAVVLSILFVFIQFVHMRLSQTSMLEASTKMQLIGDKAKLRMEKAERVTKERDALLTKQSAVLHASENSLYLLHQHRSQKLMQAQALHRALQCMFLTLHDLEDVSLPLSVFSLIPSSAYERDTVSSTVVPKNQLTADGDRVARIESENQSIAALHEQTRTGQRTDKLSVTHSLLHGSGQVCLPTHKPSLPDVIGQKFYLLLFKQHISKCCSAGDMNNFAFHLLARKYWETHRRRLRHLISSEIFQTFIVDGAPRSVRFAPTTRQIISLRCADEHASSAPNLFLAAENEILLLIEATTFKSFCNSPEYRLCCWMHFAATLSCSTISPQTRNHTIAQ